MAIIDISKEQNREIFINTNHVILAKVMRFENSDESVTISIFFHLTTAEKVQLDFSDIHELKNWLIKSGIWQFYPFLEYETKT